MVIKKGMVIGFKIDDDDENHYIDWFRYAVESGAVAIVTSIGYNSIHCVLVDYDDKLYDMKEGFLSITTAKKTVYPISSYQEV